MLIINVVNNETHEFWTKTGKKVITHMNRSMVLSTRRDRNCIRTSMYAAYRFFSSMRLVVRLCGLVLTCGVFKASQSIIALAFLNCRVSRKCLLPTYSAKSTWGYQNQPTYIRSEAPVRLG